MSSNFTFNQTFKFSYAHILSFLAILLIGYGIFMGLCYWFGGNFLSALVVALVAMSILLIGIYRLQMLKATEAQFDKSLRKERGGVAVFVIICLGLFLPYNHFWVVNDQSDVLRTRFNVALENGNDMFKGYTSYAVDRLNAYEELLDSLQGRSALEHDSIFERSWPLVIHSEASQMRLLSKDHRSLYEKAESWIEDAKKDFSPFNVYLLGNLDQIESALNSWHGVLYSSSDHPLIEEDESVERFDKDKKLLNAAIGQLDEIRRVCTDASGLSVMAILTGLMLFGLISLPYHLQGRHTKASTHYGFWKPIPMSQNDWIADQPEAQTAQPQSPRRVESIDVPEESTGTENKSRGGRRGGSFKM